MAAINIDYSSLPFSDLESHHHHHSTSDFEMRQMPASRSVCTSVAMAKPTLTLAGLQATFPHWRALVERATTNKTLL
jgi:hypothetical protein